MLTRLKVRGFKNLVDVEVRFGPFTCIAGPNGIGKSNLFDAIRFISLLADKPFVEAASEVRGGDEIGALFTKGGDGKMHLECDVLIPPKGRDDFNQVAKASYTFLTYTLDLYLVGQDQQTQLPRICLDNEELSYVAKREAKKRLAFPLEKTWLDSVIIVSPRRTPFITTERRSGFQEPVVRLRSDRMQEPTKKNRGGGKPTDYSVTNLPRSVLSSAQNAEENRTAVLLRQEMRQWRQLQLEPSGLRRPDDLRDPQRIDVSGSHVPATLYRLESSADDAGSVDAEIANRLAELVDGVHGVRVDKDIGRKLLRFMMTDSQGIELPASSLSDGTLRFVALAIMERDSEATGLLCLEEPENGIHPQRVKAMMRLLADMSVDTSLPVNNDNPLRQVLTTTHSPVVVGHADPDDVVFARPHNHRLNQRTLSGVQFVGFENSWRGFEPLKSIMMGTMGAFLDANMLLRDVSCQTSEPRPRVAELFRDQLSLPFASKGEE